MMIELLSIASNGWSYLESRQQFGHAKKTQMLMKCCRVAESTWCFSDLSIVDKLRAICFVFFPSCSGVLHTYPVDQLPLATPYGYG